MYKTHWTLEELLSQLETADKFGFQGTRNPDNLIDAIMYVERLFYNKHIDDIRARQDKLNHLWQDDNRFLAIWFDQDKHAFSDIKDVISKGCHSCLFGSVNHIRHSYKCTQSCDFCYYDIQKLPNVKPMKPLGKGLYTFSSCDMHFTLDEVLLIVERQLSSDAIGWLQQEPLEEFEAIEPLMTAIAKRGVWQYMYTNGVKATYPVVDKLAEWGLNELRFNLQATDFSPKIIDRMAYAKSKIEKVLIETPIYSKSYKNFVKYKDSILDTRLDQINLAELQIMSPERLNHFAETEGYVYKHRRGYISPVSSRHYAYDLIELAEMEKWPVVINDCSNDTKFFRGCRTGFPLGFCDYDSQFELPFKHVAHLASIVMEEGVEYEFF